MVIKVLNVHIIFTTVVLHFEVVIEVSPISFGSVITFSFSIRTYPLFLLHRVFGSNGLIFLQNSPGFALVEASWQNDCIPFRFMA